MSVPADQFFDARRNEITDLAARSAVPGSSSFANLQRPAGLMSYGIDLPDAWRQAGSDTACILKGEKPADLHVIRLTKFEFVINPKTAKALGLDIPSVLLTIADETIE